jgi:hypothetical protein
LSVTQLIGQLLFAISAAITLIVHVGFLTPNLADMLDSLVRVS